MTSQQGGLWDREIEDADLEQALITIREYQDEVKAVNDSKRIRKERLAFHGVQPGERIRCGSLAFTVGERSGGGVEIEEWTATTVTDIRDV